MADKLTLPPLTPGGVMTLRMAPDTQDYEVETMNFTDTITQENWVENREECLQLLKERAAKRIAEWIIEGGFIKIQSQRDAARSEININHKIRVLKEKK